MLRRSWNLATVLVVTACAFAFASPARAQVGVLTIKSIDAVMANAKYLLTLAGQKEQADQLEGFLNAFPGTSAIDMKRPLGLYIGLPIKQDVPPIVGFIPITKQDDFLEFLKGVNFEATKGDDGFYSIDTPFGQKVYLHFANNYVYAALDTTWLRGKLPDPEKLTPAAAGPNTLVAASIRVDEIPKEYKQTFLDQLEKGLEQAKEKQADENDAQYQARLLGLRMGRDAIQMIVEESKEVTISFDIDQKQNHLALDLALVPKPDTKLAKEIQSFGGGRSMFSGLAKDAAAHMLVHLPIVDELGKLFEKGFQEALKQESDANRKAQAEKVFKALEPTLKSEVLDFGAALRGPLADKKYVVVAGLRVKEGKKLEALLRDLIKELPEADKEKLKWDHAKHGDTAIHRFQPDDELPEEAKKVFGAQDIYFAIRDNAVLVTFGEHGLTAMKEALDGLDKGAVPATAPVVIEFSIGKLALLSPENQEKIAEAVSKVFTGADKDKDKARITLQGGAALRLRVDVNAEIVKFVVAVSPLGQ